MASSDPARRAALGRRDALLVLVGLPVALVGCTPGSTPVQQTGSEQSKSTPSTAPEGTSTASGASTATSTTLPAAGEAAAIELAMAELAGATLIGKQHTQLTAAQRTLLAAARAGHLDHAAALRSAEPTSRPKPTATITARPGTLAPKKALSELIKQERSAASRHARSTLSSTGFPALLWASMSVAASSYAAALAVGKAVPTTPPARRQLPALSETAAVSELLEQLYALIYGYQLAIGRLPVLSKAHARALAELTRLRVLRDRLIAILTAHAAEVPVAKAAYVPSVRVSDAASARLLIRRMHTALLPHCGLFVAAAASPGNRKLAFDTLAGTAKTARSWGAPLTAWPGWP